MRNFEQDLTILITGSGKTTMRHLQENLEEWIFGDGDGREVHVILPLMAEVSPGVNTVAKWIAAVGADVTIIKTEGQAMTRDISGLNGTFLSYEDEHMVLEAAFSLLNDARAGEQETAFLMLYNPENTYKQGDPKLSDLEILSDAKNYTWLSTLNLSEGLIDSFEGFETTDERILREAEEKKFAEEQAAKEAEEKAKAPAPAKKATAPRKRAAKKAVASEPTPALNVAEKPLEDSPERFHEPLCALRKNHRGDCRIDISSTPADLTGLNKLIDDAVERESLKALAKEQFANTELSATVVLSEPIAQPYSEIDIRMANLSTVEPQDVWSEVAKNAKPAAVLRQDELLAELGENIAAMGDAFSRTIRTYAALIEERNV